MAYYQDVKILVYVKRGVYTQAKAESNAEKYGMLKVLMGTAYREVEEAVKKLSYGYKFVWHAEHCMLEIDMPHARWEARFPETKTIMKAVDELATDHKYVWELGFADLENAALSKVHAHGSVRNPFLRIKASVEVMI